MRAREIALLVLLVLAPAAGAVVPGVPEGDTDAVSFRMLYDSATHMQCDSYDPVIGLATTDLTSTIQRAPDGPLTRYTIHLDAIPGDAACPAIDVSFAADAVWPAQRGTYSFGSFWTECGATGSIYMAFASDSIGMHTYWRDVPVACDFPIPRGSSLTMDIQPVAPTAGLVCAPRIVAACSGAKESVDPWSGPCPRETFSVMVAGFVVVQGSHGCDWATGTEYGQVADGFGLFGVRATGDACTVRVGDFVGGPAQQSAACPTEVGDLVYGFEWMGILP